MCNFVWFQRWETNEIASNLYFCWSLMQVVYRNTSSRSDDFIRDCLFPSACLSVLGEGPHFLFPTAEKITHTEINEVFDNVFYPSLMKSCDDERVLHSFQHTILLLSHPWRQCFFPAPTQQLQSDGAITCTSIKPCVSSSVSHLTFKDQNVLHRVRLFGIDPRLLRLNSAWLKWCDNIARCLHSARWSFETLDLLDVHRASFSIFSIFSFFNFPGWQAHSSCLPVSNSGHTINSFCEMHHTAMCVMWWRQGRGTEWSPADPLLCFERACSVCIQLTQTCNSFHFIGSVGISDDQP